jgi:hypothetical protein
LITPFTSLLVLETDEMYRRFALRRSSTKDFAHYPAPARIPVRPEPPGGDPVAFGGRGALWPASLESLTTPKPASRWGRHARVGVGRSWHWPRLRKRPGRLGGAIDEPRRASSRPTSS